MAAPNLTDINNFFATRPNVFHKNMYARTWRTDPFDSLFPKVAYDMEEGRVPTIITSTHELPTNYPDVTQHPSLSNGTGDPACDVPATIIKAGYKTRTFQLEQAAFETEVICLSDLQNKFQAVRQVQNKEKGLTEFSTVWKSDWARIHNIGMIDRKLTTSGATTMSEKSDSLFDFSTLTLPTNELNWVHLDGLYDMLIRRGGGLYAPGSAEGEPVFSIVLGPAYKRALFKDDEQVRSTVNWSPQVLQNFKARGISTAINGYAASIDDFPIRIAADGVTKIYPTINQATTSGYESVFNPNYRTVANGGLAVYEVVTILCTNIYEIQVRPVGDLQFGMAGYSPTQYTGSVQWINNKDMAQNKLGNKGLYRMDIQQAAKPIYPELGYSILTLAKD